MNHCGSLLFFDEISSSGYSGFSWFSGWNIPLTDIVISTDGICAEWLHRVVQYYARQEWRNLKSPARHHPTEPSHNGTFQLSLLPSLLWDFSTPRNTAFHTFCTINYRSKWRRADDASLSWHIWGTWETLETLETGKRYCLPPTAYFIEKILGALYELCAPSTITHYAPRITHYFISMDNLR